MYKGKDLIGKQVITYDTGSAVESVTDVIFDAHNNSMLAFLIDEGGLITTARILPFGNIKSIGEDAITIENRDAIVAADADEQVKAMMDSENVAIGTRVMTEDGKDLGAISDIYFNETSGVIEGYEVSGGIFADAYSGASFLPAPKTIRLGDDFAFVPNETGAFMEEQVGGIKGKLNEAGEKASEWKDTTSEKAGDFAGRAGEMAASVGSAIGEKASEAKDVAMNAANTAQEKAGELKDSASQALAAETVEQLLGKRVHQVVKASNGSIIAAQGQIVTESIISRARAESKEQQLIEACDSSVQQAASEKVGNTVQGVAASAGEAASDGAAKIKETAGSVWEKIKDTATDLKDQASSKAEKMQIQEALGHPVNRVIMDKSDQVILENGALITNEAIEKARSAGVLDMLLSSVQK